MWSHTVVDYNMHLTPFGVLIAPNWFNLQICCTQFGFSLTWWDSTPSGPWNFYIYCNYDIRRYGAAGTNFQEITDVYSSSCQANPSWIHCIQRFLTAAELHGAQGSENLVPFAAVSTWSWGIHMCKHIPLLDLFVDLHRGRSGVTWQLHPSNPPPAAGPMKMLCCISSGAL